MEKDDEIHNSPGTSLDFGARIYDPRIGKWLSVDPLQAKYPDLSTYNFVANNPIWFVDPDGKKIVIHYTKEKMRRNGTKKIVKAKVILRSAQDVANFDGASVGYDGFVMNTIESIKYGMQADNVGGHDVYEELLTTKKKVHIEQVNSANNPEARFAGSGYNSKNSTIVFADQLESDIVDKQTDEIIGSQSTALELLEESIHAVRDIIDGVDNSVKVGGKNTTDMPAQMREEENVNRMVNEAAGKLSGESTRENYQGTEKRYKNNRGRMTPKEDKKGD